MVHSPFFTTLCLPLIGSCRIDRSVNEMPTKTVAATSLKLAGSPSKAKRVGRPSKARGAPNTSDAADARWTVRGVPVNVRRMAIKASEDKGMTVGDWLVDAIVSHSRSAKSGVLADADSIPSDGTTNVPAIPLSSELKDVLQAIQERLEKIEAEKAKSFLGRLFG